MAVLQPRLRSTGLPVVFQLPNNVERTHRLLGGFTLLEVIVALAILVLTLGVLYQAFGTGTKTVGTAKKHTHAALLAESGLAALGVERPLAVGESRVVVAKGYDLHTVVTAVETADGTASSRSPYQLYEVMLTVEWRDGDSVRSIFFRTFRLAETK